MYEVRPRWEATAKGFKVVGVRWVVKQRLGRFEAGSWHKISTLTRAEIISSLLQRPRCWPVVGCARPSGSCRGLPRWSIRRHQPLRNPCQARDHHAKGYPTGPPDSRRACLGKCKFPEKDVTHTQTLQVSSRTRQSVTGRRAVAMLPNIQPHADDLCLQILSLPHSV